MALNAPEGSDRRRPPICDALPIKRCKDQSNWLQKHDGASPCLDGFYKSGLSVRGLSKKTTWGGVWGFKVFWG
jgi:hypothetical protein